MGGETMAVMKRDGGYWMDVACFYNVVDNGKLARYSRSLAGCENLDRATCFTSTNASPFCFIRSVILCILIVILPGKRNL